MEVAQSLPSWSAFSFPKLSSWLVGPSKLLSINPPESAKERYDMTYLEQDRKLERTWEGIWIDGKTLSFKFSGDFSVDSQGFFYPLVARQTLAEFFDLWLGFPSMISTQLS